MDQSTTANRTLVRYDTACRAIAQARATDEVLKIRDQGGMLRAYARQAKNRDLEITAVEIRVRAERRIGELIQRQRETIGLAKGAAGTGRPKLGGFKSNPPKKDSRPSLAEAGIDKNLADRARKLAALPTAQFETKVSDWRADQTSRAEKVTTEILAAPAPHPHVTHNSGEFEWYTPAPYIEAARTVMDGIDLDPASSARANEIVKADQIFTTEDDGLAQDWRGRVWMNPPYAPTLVQRFTAKLVKHVIAHDLEAAVVLVNNATDTQWFRAMADVADAICFKTGRIQFHSPTKAAAAGLQGQVFLYFGAEPDRFVQVFGQFGFLMIRANYARLQFDEEPEQ
jgi:phage N-6-adenine-methyltransferase